MLHYFYSLWLVTLKASVLKFVFVCVCVSVTVDYNSASHTQRKVNKRELKALLKQTKKKPSTVDETVIAAIDELAIHLKGKFHI